MTQYPIILIPSDITNSQTKEPPVQIIEQKVGTKPIEPRESPKNFYIQGTAIWSFIAVIIGGFISTAFSLPILPCILFLLFLVVSRVIYLFQSYPKRLGEHRNKVIRCEEDMRTYMIRRRSYIAEYQHTSLLRVLRKTISHNGNNNNPPQKGKHEIFFQQHLNKYFPGNIHNNLQVIIPEFQHPYTPDFAYISKNNNLHIDIELDEPYAYFNGKPTHYEGNRKDARRNDFFITRGWVVIRFSEQQVFYNVKSCCKTVAKVVATITGDDSILNAFSDIPDLQPMKQWTEEEATDVERP
jgi:very-short-patch-repair endonuclease